MLAARGEDKMGERRNSEPSLSTHRIGKIARLPAAIRQAQLSTNVSKTTNRPRRLLEWLHALPEVKKVLKRLFEGRPISEQNLSAWKQGGFRDWQRHQQVRARAHEFLEEGRELAEEVAAPGAGGSLLDRVSDRMALTATLELCREAEAGEPGPERTRTLLTIARDVARLRRADHERQQAELAQQRWLHERDLTLREVREHFRQQSRRRQWPRGAPRVRARLRAELIRGLTHRDIAPERGQWICGFLAEHEEFLREHGIPGLPKDEQLNSGKCPPEMKNLNTCCAATRQLLEKEAADRQADGSKPRQGGSR